MSQSLQKYMLAFSTSSGVASVALGRGDHQAYEVLDCVEIVDYKMQSAQLLPQLQGMFKRLGVRSNDIAVLGVDIGPGGFTSLRTACGVVQGLAMAWGVPVVPVSSFEAMLGVYMKQHAHHVVGQPMSCVIDARLNELYCARLSCQGGQWVYVVSPQLCATEALESFVAEGPWLADLGAFNMASQRDVLRGVCCPANALGVLEATWLSYCAGRTFSAQACQPLYVRNKVAQTTLERLAGKDGTG